MGLLYLYLYPLNKRLSGPPGAGLGVLLLLGFEPRSLVIIRTKRGARETESPCVRFNLNGFVRMKNIKE